jgi:hypothetical protein
MVFHRLFLAISPLKRWKERLFFSKVNPRTTLNISQVCSKYQQVTNRCTRLPHSFPNLATTVAFPFFIRTTSPPINPVKISPFLVAIDSGPVTSPSNRNSALSSFVFGDSGPLSSIGWVILYKEKLINSRARLSSQ